ncbi:MAG: DUF4382 domain-containing protein, partial [Pseudomonadales bacterium]
MTFQLGARTLLLGMLAMFALSGCGGGGGGGSAGPAAQAGNPAPTTSQTPDDQTGVVGILIKDAPTQAFTRIIMHVTGVELLPADDGEGHATVFEGDKELDLLALQNFYDTLAVSENVPVGDYEKIRLFVDSITLYYLNDADEEVSTEAVVPANGKVDLNPRGTFTVSANTAILIEIDLDAKKSFHVIETGNGNGNAKQKWRFRPVVFVDIQQLKALEGLMRLSGTVGDIDAENNQFDLCEVDTQLHTDTNGCIPINVGDETSLFGENGEPIAFDDLATGDPVTAYGFAVVVQSAHDDDSDDDGDDDSGMSSDDSDADSEQDMDDDTVRMVQLDAVVIQKAAAAVIRSLSGTALSAPDESGIFTLDLADDEQ